VLIWSSTSFKFDKITPSDLLRLSSVILVFQVGQSRQRDTLPTSRLSLHIPRLLDVNLLPSRFPDFVLRGLVEYEGHQSHSMDLRTCVSVGTALSATTTHDLMPWCCCTFGIPSVPNRIGTICKRGSFDDIPL
jgi:hypothetical protein